MGDNLKKQYTTFLNSENTEERSRTQKIAALEAMVELMKGKTKKQLSAIWAKDLQEVTEKYYRSALFPDAEEVIPSGNKDYTTVRWKLNTADKKRWWINRMMGKDQRKIKSVGFYKSFMKHLKECGEHRHTLTRDQKEMLVKEFKYAELRVRGKCLHCETANAMTKDGYCSAECERIAEMYRKHQERAVKV